MAKGSGTDGSRAFMKRWLEPSVQSKASFEDDGLMRYGVVENMAPLGSLPKPKKTGTEMTVQPIRRIILKPSSAHVANSAPAAPPKSPPAEPEPEPSPPPPAAPLTPPRRRSLAVKDADDEDYDPKEGSRRRQSGRTSLARKARRSSGARRSSITVSKAVTPKELPEEEPEDKEFIDRVVEMAVDEAIDHYRYPTAWALRTLYDEKCGDAKFVSMIEQVFRQTADAATMRKFSKMIEVKKREGKKDNQGCYYFIPPSTNNRFTPHKPKTAPYSRLLHPSSEHSEARPAKKAKTSHARETPGKMASTGGINGEARTPSRKRGRRGSASSDSSLSSAMSLSSPEASVSVDMGVGVDVESQSPTFRGGTTGHGPESKDAPKSRPINTRGKSLASKQARSSPSESNSPTQPISSIKQSIHVNAGMPGKVATTPLFPNLSGKNSKAAKSADKTRMPDDDDSFWDRRRDAQKVTNSINVLESSVRGRDENEEATPSRKTRRTRHSVATAITTRATRSASKRPHDDAESIVSPIAWSVPGDNSSNVGSRAATPTTLRPAKKPRTGLRIKSS